MFTPIHMRSANAYRSVGVETSVIGADPHHLIYLVFEAVLESLSKTKTAMINADIAGKGQGIGRAVRLIDEGLKAALDEKSGGEVAKNLRMLYDYCTLRLTEANIQNDLKKVDEVQQLIFPVAQAWQKIRSEVMNTAPKV